MIFCCDEIMIVFVVCIIYENNKLNLEKKLMKKVSKLFKIWWINIENILIRFLIFFIEFYFLLSLNMFYFVFFVNKDML